MEVRNPEPEKKRLTLGHSFVMEKLILRSPLPPVIGLGSTVVSRSPWWGPPILLSLLLLSCSLHGKETNGRVGGRGSCNHVFPSSPQVAAHPRLQVLIYPYHCCTKELFQSNGGSAQIAIHSPTNTDASAPLWAAGCWSTHGTHPGRVYPTRNGADQPIPETGLGSECRRQRHLV